MMKILPAANEVALVGSRTAASEALDPSCLTPHLIMMSEGERARVVPCAL